MTPPIVERLTRYVASLQYEDLPSGASSTFTPTSPHPATAPLPPRAPVRYRPRMHNDPARHDDIHHTVRMDRIASPCSSRMTTCGLDRNQQDLFPHHERLNLRIVAAMRHNSYRSITKTYDPQLRRATQT